MTFFSCAASVVTGAYSWVRLVFVSCALKYSELFCFIIYEKQEEGPRLRVNPEHINVMAQEVMAYERVINGVIWGHQNESGAGG